MDYLPAQPFAVQTVTRVGVPITTLQGFIQPPRMGEYSPLKQIYSPLEKDRQLPPQEGVPVLQINT